MIPYRPILILAVACFFGMSPWFSTSVISLQLQTEFGLSQGQIISLALGVQFGFVVGALVSSILNLADFFGPRLLVVVGAFSAAICNLIPVALPTYVGFMLARVTTGASLALLYPAGLKVMSTWVKQHRGTALGLLLGGLTLGTAAPHLLRAAGSAIHLDWEFVIFGTSILAIIGGLIVWFWGKQGPFPFPKAPFNPKQIALIMRERRLQLIAIGYFGHMWELYAMWFWFPVFIRARMQEHGIEHFESVSSLYTALALGSGAIGCWLGGVWGDRVSRIQAAKISLMISGTCGLLIGWSSLPLWSILALGVIWGFSLNADSAQYSTLTSESADPRYVGTTLTIQLALGFLLTGVTINLVPSLTPTYGWGACLAMLSGGPAIGLIALGQLKDTQR